MQSLVCIQLLECSQTTHKSWELFSFGTKAGALKDVIVLAMKAAGGAMPNIQKDVASCCEDWAHLQSLWTQFPTWYFYREVFLLLEARGYLNPNHRESICFQEMFWNQVCFGCCFKCANLMDVIFMWWQVIMNKVKDSLVRLCSEPADQAKRLWQNAIYKCSCARNASVPSKDLLGEWESSLQCFSSQTRIFWAGHHFWTQTYGNTLSTSNPFF